MTYELAELRRVARILNGGTPPSGDAAMWDGEIPFVTPPDLNGLDGAPIGSTLRSLTPSGVPHSNMAPPGSVLLSTRAPIGHIGRVTSSVAFNQGCRALVPLSGQNQRYLAYALVAAREAMNAYGLGTTFIELSSSALAQILVPVVPPQTQRAIADFLDRETAQIDAFIAKNEELIALLTERRAAVASAAMGQRSIPLVAVRHVVRLIQTGPFGSQLHAEDYVPGGIPLINPMHMIGGRAVPSPDVAVSDEKAHELRRHLLEVGDVVVARRGELGRSALVTDPDPLLICGTGSMLVRPNPARVMPRYLQLAIGSEASRATLREQSVGSTMENLSAGALAALRVPLPDVSEQHAILTDLEAANARIDRALGTAEQVIDLARERRAALISAAVTGKIDLGVSA